MTSESPPRLTTNDPLKLTPSFVDEVDKVSAESELLILSDGRILAHYLTPELSDVIQAALNPSDTSKDSTV